MSYRLLLKSSVCRNVPKHSNVRMFSSTTTYPFMLIDHLINSFDKEDRISDYTKWYHCGISSTYGTKQTRIKIKDHCLREEVLDAMTSPFLHNATLDFQLPYSCRDHNPSRIVIDHYPVKSYLPPLPEGSKIQNIAMSSLPQRDKDWVVGVKLQGSQISLCRPFGNPEWIDVEATPECISPFSTLMFSKKDQKFYIPSSGGNYLFSLDLHHKEKDKPELFDILFDELPKSAFPKLEHLISCCRTDHFVESPTGQQFLVKWYSENDTDDYIGVKRSVMLKTVKFMVFRAEKDGDEDDHKNMIYTEDIGDLCIFVGHSEAVCVPASSSPGLKPNCIYFVGYNYGVYDLTTNTCTTFFTDDETDTESRKDYPLSSSEFPYWPLPLPL